MVRLCDAVECINPAAKAGYCWAHIKRRHRQKSADPAVRHKHETPQQMLMEAAISFVDADDEDEAAYQRGWGRLRKAALRYVQAEKHANQHTAVAAAGVRMRDESPL